MKSGTLILVCLAVVFCVASWHTSLAEEVKVSVDGSQSLYKNDADGIISRFQEYLRIDTAQPNPDYLGAAAWLEKQAARIGLKYKSIEFAKNKPISILTWEGSDAERPAIMLNSHVDVVPADKSKWDFDPFSAERTPDGNIYARGSQDMKCVGTQYLEAVDQLKKKGFQPKSTVHVVFVPDEEVGAEDGMISLVKSGWFKENNIGLMMDEGLASPEEEFIFYKGERSPWWVRITATGPAGHGSMLLKDPAMQKMSRVMEKIYAYRDSQMKLVEQGKDLGEVTTVNVDWFKAGHTQDCKKFSYNVVPNVAELGVDVRITPLTPLEEFEEIVKGWTDEEGVTYDFDQKCPMHTVTPLENNPYWDAFSDACDKLGIKLHKRFFPAASDSRHVRMGGVKAFGFSPMHHTPVLLHDHNEYHNDKIYLNGVKIYESIIPALTDNVKLE